jgi:hypothetical protein
MPKRPWCDNPLLTSIIADNTNGAPSPKVAVRLTEIDFMVKLMGGLVFYLIVGVLVCFVTLVLVLFTTCQVRVSRF